MKLRDQLTRILANKRRFTMKTKQKGKKQIDQKYRSSGFGLSVRPGRWRRRKRLQDEEFHDFYQNGSLLQNADPTDFGLAVNGW